MMKRHKSNILIIFITICLICFFAIIMSPLHQNNSPTRSFDAIKYYAKRMILQNKNASIDFKSILPTESNNLLISDGESTTMVILLSSSARSGSSFIGEVLSTADSTVMFFEPLHIINSDPCLKSTTCIASHVSDVLNCNLSTNFITYLSKRANFLSFFNRNTRACPKTSSKIWSECLHKVDIKKECDNAKVKLAKIIRARLSDLEMLLEKYENLKVIHLLRDPRGSMNSINKFKWEKNVELLCDNLSKDIVSYERLKSKYPNQLTQITYENFSIDPEEKTKELFKFTYGINELPKETTEYLLSHTTETIKGAMSRIKNTREIYQEWRKVIKLKTFKTVENNTNCQEVIKYMGHSLFNDLDNARNLLIPLFVINS